MNPITLAAREILHRWKSSALIAIIVAAITGSLTFLSVNNLGYQKEIGRSARDIGSNVVILPVGVDQFDYHSNGGFSDVTMSYDVVQQVIEYKASLNHLIPMLERRASCELDQGPSGEAAKASARVVGLRASIPLPGRPKSPMQKAIEPGKVQLGNALAQEIGLKRDAENVSVKIEGRLFAVSRINKANGTWQDAAVFMDLTEAQELFKMQNRISRIEAIECTQEQCEQTGLKSDVILANELARITDQAVLLRRESMADARSKIRVISRENLGLLQNVLWAVLAISIMGLSCMNSIQRQSEIGVLQSVGYGQARVVVLFLLRTIFLTLVGAAIGMGIGAIASYWLSIPMFGATGKKFAIDWLAVSTIGATAVLLAAVATSLPALLAAAKNPADLIGRES